MNLFYACSQLPDASPEQIKKAYYNCMKECHPDLSGDDPDTTNFCMFVNEVYEVRVQIQRMLNSELPITKATNKDGYINYEQGRRIYYIITENGQKSFQLQRSCPSQKLLRPIGYHHQIQFFMSLVGFSNRTKKNLGDPYLTPRENVASRPLSQMAAKWQVLSDPVQRMVYDEIHGYALTAINPFMDDSSTKDLAFVDEFSCIGT